MFSFHRREPPRRLTPFSWAPFRPAARSAFLPLARRFSRAPTIDSPSSEIVQDYHDRPRSAPVKYIESSPLSILDEALVECTWQPGPGPRRNSGPLTEHALNYGRSIVQWDTIISAPFHKAYYSAVESSPQLCATVQQRRHLSSEGDVAPESRGFFTSTSALGRQQLQ
ncbi:hypothetical protein JCM9279_000547 [Rhodotorula babjevae]